MTIIITCGHQASRLRLAHSALTSAGVAEALPSRREGFTAGSLHEAILNSHGNSGRPPVGQLAPGKVWHEIATDLVAGNIGQAIWGWAAASGVWLLDFWKSVDPTAKFVLVYSAPEIAIGQQMSSSRDHLNAVGDLIHQWTVTNTELLRFHLRHPGDCLLVNSAAIASESQAFVARVNASWGTSLVAPADAESRSCAESLVAAWLAKPFVDDKREASALYREMESASDLPMNAASASLLRQSAWLEYYGRTGAQEGMQAGEAAAQLERENELLALELEQAKEELDHIFQKSGGLATSSRALMQASAQSTRPVEARFDLRAGVNGENWYEPESDGRWAGPGVHSTIRVLPLPWEQLEVRIEVVDGMDPEMLRGIRVSVNAVSIDVSADWFGFPCLITGRFAADSVAAAPVWEFSLDFPMVLSPSERGSNDRRQLAVRVQSLTLRRVSDAPVDALAT